MSAPDLPTSVYLNWRACAICKMPYHQQFSFTEAAWAEAGLHPRDYVCLECATKKMGRPITLADYDTAWMGSHTHMGSVVATLNSLAAGVSPEEIRAQAQAYWDGYRNKMLWRLPRMLVESMHEVWKEAIGKITADDLRVFSLSLQDAPLREEVAREILDTRLSFWYKARYLTNLVVDDEIIVLPDYNLRRFDHSEFIASLTEDDLAYLRTRATKDRAATKLSAEALTLTPTSNP